MCRLMPQRFQREVILIGLLAILFVQVCPLFDDPTPLTKVRVPFTAIIVVFLLLPFAALVRYCGNREAETPAPQSVALFELTCARLC
jgi:hypothetical protein